MLRGFRIHRCPYWIRPSITVSDHNGLLCISVSFDIFPPSLCSAMIVCYKVLCCTFVFFGHVSNTVSHSFFLLWDNCSAWKTKYFFFGCLMLVFSLKATINYYNLFCLGCQEEFRRVSYYNLGICELVYLN
jgi:hypothetical protein